MEKLGSLAGGEELLYRLPEDRYRRQEHVAYGREASSFHGDFRIEVKVLSLKRYWLAQNQELVRQHREKVEDILGCCMHRVGWFFHEEREHTSHTRYTTTPAT